MKSSLRASVLGTAIAVVLTFANGALAQSSEADEQALAEARADLERAARRVAELSRKLGHAERAPLVIERRMARRPVLGVVLAPDAQRGVRIAGITPDSGAANAGLRSGDLILSIDGHALSEAEGAARAEAARRRLADLAVDRPVTVEYERDGERGSARVTPQLGDSAVILPGGPDIRLVSPRRIVEHGDGRLEIEADSIEHRTGRDAPRVHRIIRHGVRGAETGDVEEIGPAPAAGVAPGVHREIIRLGPQGDCGDAPCRLPLLADALRWNGVNLASLDAQLGRYFGAERGVLVLSTSSALSGLQAGDVIRSIDGKAVATPREAMAALRDRPAGSEVDVAYLRDRKPGSARISVPGALPLRVPVAPPPPAPPAPPDAAAPPAPPAPPEPPGPGERIATLFTA